MKFVWRCFPRLAIATVALLAVTQGSQQNAYGQRVVLSETGEASTGIYLDDFGSVFMEIDLDQNGFSDLLIGAPHFDLPGEDNGQNGAAYFLWGPFSNGQPDGTTRVAPPSGSMFYEFGISAAEVFNYSPDIGIIAAIGAPGLGSGTSFHTGGVYLYFFAENTLQPLLLPSPSLEPSIGFGHRLTSCDFNGDGYGDLFVGTAFDVPSGVRETYVYFGGASPDSIPDITIVASAQGNDERGYLVAAGDVNNDGYEDILVGAPLLNKAYLVLGQDSPPSNIYLGDGATHSGTVFDGGAGSDFGRAIAGGSDITGDGYIDVAIASNLGGNTADTVHIFEGPFSQSTYFANDATIAVVGASSFAGGRSIGTTIAMGGDVDADGVSDLIVGTYAGDRNLYSGLTTANKGYVSVILGGPDLANIEFDASNYSSSGRVWHIEPIGLVSRDIFGSTVGFSTDLFSENGRDEVLVAAPGSYPGDFLGKVYVFEMDSLVFSNESPEVGLDLQSSSEPYSLVSMDFNGDDLTDFIATMDAPTSSSQLYVGTPANGNDYPQFSASTSGLGTGQRGVAAADYDNDGDVDIFIAHATTPQLLVNTSGVLSDEIELLGSDGTGSSIAAESRAGLWADFDRDGWVDLLVCRALGGDGPSDILGKPPVLLRNLGSSGQDGFEDVTVAAGISVHSTASVGGTWIDFDIDGDLDLFLGSLSNNEMCRLYRNNDDGTFSDATLSTVGPIYEVSGISPYFLFFDAYPELVLSLRTGSGTGNVLVLQQNPYGVYEDLFRDFGFSGFDEIFDTKDACVADFDLDGRVEIVTLPVGDVLPSYFRMTENRFTFESDVVGLEAGTNSGYSASDFDNDGDLDLLIGGHNDRTYFHNRSSFGYDSPSDTCGNWFKVKLQGSECNNYYGIGAVLKYTAPGVPTQRIVIDGGSGRGTQQPNIATFGLGCTNSTGTLTVTWPDGYSNPSISVPPLSQNNATPMVLHDHSVSISTGSVEVVPSALADGRIHWLFRWRTKYPTPRFRDAISVSMPPGSTILPTLITMYNADESRVWHDVGSMEHHHEMTLITDCAPGVYTFVVKSSAKVWVGGNYQVFTAAAPQKKIVIPICFQQL